MTGDTELRTAIRDEIAQFYPLGRGAWLLEELGIQHGAARIDLALLDGLLHGFEIKSDRDSLKRLADQAAIFGTVLDRITLIAGPRHACRAIAMVPRWWGIVIAHQIDGGRLVLTTERPPRSNPRLEPVAVAQLLWRSEALGILEEVGAAAGVRSKPRRDIYERLADCMTLSRLRSRVLRQLRMREGWQSAGQRGQGGD